GRMRFPLRVIDAMRAEADGMALGVRMSVLEQVDDGLTEDLAVEALSEYAAHGIDFLNLNVGTISSDRELAEAIPGMGTPSARSGRMRFPLRVIDAMRAEADGMALGVRMSVLEQVDDGLTEDLAVEALSEYAAHGIDFLNLNVGTISSDRELAEAIPGMGTPSA